MSVHMIIYIVIGLIILLLITAAFTGRFSVFNQAQTCQGQGGTCEIDLTKKVCGADTLKVRAQGCKDPKDDKSKSGPCCIPKKEIGFE